MIKYGDYIKLIKESIIYTHNIERYKMNLIHELDFIGIDCQVDVINKMAFDLTLKNPRQLKDKQLYELFFSITQNQFGYYPSFYLVVLKNGMKNQFNFKSKHEKEFKKDDLEKEFKSYMNIDKVEYIIIRFEGNYEDGLYKNTLEIPDKLYHISSSIFKEKILNYGLSPKFKGRSSFYPGRIHFLFDLSDYIILINKFKYNDVKRGKDHTNYNIYEIDTMNIKDKLILHTDPNSDGCYTYDIIPRENIKLIKENI